MTDPILYLSMLLGLGGVYVLISSFHDDDEEKYIYSVEHLNLARQFICLQKHIIFKKFLEKVATTENSYTGVT